jgi:pimeloyl-ACP methyl ester carboxylesterase
MVSFPVLTSDSKLQAQWQFDEVSPLSARYFSEEFDGYQLEGRVLSASQRETKLPQLLAIHGARSDYTKLNAILYPLQTLGIASLSFNLSGHNLASGIGLGDTSLKNNLQEALRYSSRLGTRLHAVLGHSLGGALALKIAEVHRTSVKKIVLFCPALYSEDAYHKRFGNSFKEVISVPFGFLDSQSLTFLREFDGDLMLIIGQYDALKSTDFGGIAGKSAGMVNVQSNQSKERIINSAIPFEVIDSIEKCITPQRLSKIVLPDCDHAISAWLRANPVRAYWVASKVAEFLDMP